MLFDILIILLVLALLGVVQYGRIVEAGDTDQVAGLGWF